VLKTKGPRAQKKKSALDHIKGWLGGGPAEEGEHKVRGSVYTRLACEIIY
jgi:hypothetical protein